MVERIKNKKGFTIIEIMVVIALIGILAAVLIPQFGSVRDRARETGVLTNIKSVEAYVASAIDNAADVEAIEDAIANYFNEDANNLDNPFTVDPAEDTNTATATESDGAINVTAVADAQAPVIIADGDDDLDREPTITVGDGVNLAGSVFVAASTEDNRLVVYIMGFDGNGNLINNSLRRITQ